MTLLRLWLAMTAAIAGAFFVYAFVPILLPLIAIAGGLALVTALIVLGVRRLERLRDGGSSGPRDR